MGYSDEAIIQMMNKHKRGVYGSIEDEICIRGKKICFRQDALFDNKMSVMLPDNFKDMSPEAAKSKYPMEQRPQVIKTSEDTKINFTFSLIDQPITNEQVEELVKYIKKILRNAKPDIRFVEDKIQEVNKLTIGWFDFVSNGYDQKIYNLMYYLPIDGKVMHGIFNCPLQDADVWKTIILQVIQTIREIREGESN